MYKKLNVYKIIDSGFDYIIAIYADFGKLQKLIKEYNTDKNLQKNYENVIDFLGDLEITEYLREVDEIDSYTL